MSKTFFKLGLGLLAAAGMMWPAGVRAANTTLHGHVPAVVSQLAPKGQMAATNKLHLSIGLPLHNQAALNALMEQISDPGSPNYKKYLTPAEFTDQFGPTTNEYQAVIDFARANGFTISKTHGNRMLVDVVAKAGDVEHAFHVKMKTYRHPTEGRDFYAPDVEPSVDSSVPVLSVQGMSDYTVPHPASHKKPASGGSPGNGSGPFGGYIGKDFRNAYIPGTQLDGSGQIVGLLQFDGYLTSDILAYESLAGYTNVPLENVLLDGFNGSAGPNNDEVCLDIEASIAMAPALQKVVVFEGLNANSILSSMVASNMIKQFSASWGYFVDATSVQLYQQMAVQGQTFLNASGDGDAWVGGIPTFVNSCESPYITMVGGTTLTMNGNGVSYASEKCWNWGFIGNYNWNPDGFFGSSGGISTVVPIPSWQQGIDMSTNHGSLTFRNVPDIALTGDNVFVISSGGSGGSFGGTSCASPLWAGFMALVNQQAVINGKPSVGFLAPQVYALLKTTNYAKAFHDVVLGDNTWDQSPNDYHAVPGYDLCTGLGTPNGTNFVNALVGVSAPTNTIGPIISAPRGPWGTTLGVLNGGNPNGLWFLFVQDDTMSNTGMISSGWSVTLTSANPVGYASDNQMFASPAVTTVSVGANWAVKVAVTNYGPSIATNVVVTDDMPLGVGLSYVSGVPSTGSVMQFGSTLNWSVGNLASGAGASLNLTFNATVAGTYSNGVSVASSVVDPNPDDDTAGAVANVGVTIPPVLSGSAVLAGGKFKFHVDESSGSTSVIVQDSTNLVNWVSIYTNTTPFDFTNSTAGAPYMFYRVVTGP